MFRRSLSEALLSRRDRLLASPDFQRWILRMPFLRQIARRRARSLFDLCAGFVYSQVLLACVRLRILEALATGPRQITDLAREARLPEEAMRTLLRAAAALQLVQWRGDAEHCRLGSQGAALLGNPGLLPMIAHHALLYADLADPVALLRGELRDGQLAPYWGYAGSDRPAAATEPSVAPYSGLMSASQGLVAQQILAAYSLRRHRSLLDVGGGDGTFATLAARDNPSLHVTCFDLPAVAELARARIARAGLGTRVQAASGDFLSQPLPAGSDVVSLIRVLHDHGDAQAVRLLRAVRAALPAHGTLLIAEPMSGTPGAARVSDVYFGFYLLAMGSGRARTPTQLTRLLRAAGFAAPRLHATALPMAARVLVAHCSTGRSVKRS